MTKQKRVSLDWEAIERDWRTGSFTLRELADKHNTDAATISRRQKRDREADSSRWQKDLTGVVRQATNAQLVAAMVNEKINEGQQQVNNVVLAVAQVNSQVILRHRGDILAIRNVAMEMLHELSLATHSADELTELFRLATEGLDAESMSAVQQSFRDMLKLHSRVGSIHKLADTMAKVQAMERKAFSLDDEDGDGGNKGRELTDVERAARVAAILDAAKKRQAAAGGGAK